MTGYTCIDFETTGLFPKRDDRVVEVGVVFVDEAGDIEGEWSTLLTSIHRCGWSGERVVK